MNTEPRLTAVAYCRTSTVQQKESETIRAQIECNKRLIERHGVRLLRYGPKKDGWLVDDGVTGSLLDGRTFATFVDDLEAGRVKVDFLVVYSLSRIARLDKTSRDMTKLVRSATDNARIKAVLLGAGVKVIDGDGVNDPASVVFDLKLTLSTEEYKLIRQRTMAGKSQRLAEGRHARGGRPPFGWRHVHANGVDRKQGWDGEIHPEDAAGLKRILGWYAEGGETFAARQATRAKILTPMASTTNRKNKAKDWSPTRWSPVSVRHIVANVRVYLTGEQTQVFDGKPYTLKYPPLIDTKLYAAVEARRKAGTLKRRATMLTTGFVDCVCGSHVHQKNTHDKHRTSCPKGCGAMHEEEFSAALWTAVVCRMIQIRQHERTMSGGEDPYGPQLQAAKGKLAAVQADLSALLDLYLKLQATGSLNMSAWKAKNDALNDRFAHAQAEVDRLEREREGHAQRRATEATVEAKIDAVLDELVRGEPTLDRKRQLLGELLAGEKVVVAWPKRGKGEGKLVSHAEITLPKFGDLPPLTLRTDTYVWEQLDGVMDDGTVERIVRAGHAGLGMLVHASMSRALARAREARTREPRAGDAA